VSGGVTGVARAALLGASRNRVLNKAAARYGMRFGGSRFVAGETLEQFVPIAKRLNASGFTIAAAILGEGVASEAETREVVAEYRALMTRIAGEKLQSTVALKLTHLGLAIDEDLAAKNIRDLVEYAATLGIFVRIDMEESWYVDPTLLVYRELRKSGLSNVGVVLQAYLYRTPGDLDDLLPLQPNLRLVKGAYLESPQIAYPRKADVDLHYKGLIERALRGGGFCAIATHDEDAIAHALACAKAASLRASDRFEFQMLYGVRPRLQQRLVLEGQPLRIAAPYGRAWFPYFMRRLAERPANVAFVLGSMLKG
jgi:proline dehydrogenase